MLAIQDNIIRYEKFIQYENSAKFGYLNNITQSFISAWFQWCNPNIYWRRIVQSRAGLINSGFTCQPIRYSIFNSRNWPDFHADIEWLRFSCRIILFKSLIANIAGFLLWLSITNIMIEVFKVASVQWLLFYQWVWFIL